MTNNLNPKHQQFTFGPRVDISSIPTQVVQNLQEMLDDLGGVPPNVVTLNGFFARYNPNGDLLVDLFIRNGLKTPIRDFHGRVQVITRERNVIAVDDFQFTLAEFGELQSGNSRPWTLFFDRRCVMRRLEPIGLYTLDTRMYFEKSQ